MAPTPVTRAEALRGSAATLLFGTTVAAASTLINLWALLLGWVVLATLLGSRFADLHTGLVRVTAAALGAFAFLGPAVLFVMLNPRMPERRRRFWLIAFAMVHLVAAVAIFAYTATHPIDL